jgi:uncharacterized membrane protein YeaQ/YmgE (transglycosylase-associated protein family)
MRDAGLVEFLLVGLVSGWIASILVRGHVRLRGCIVNTVIGMVGAVVGGFLFRLAGLHAGPGFVGGVLVATVGAVVFLVLLRLGRSL